jgi:plastocyanin
MACAKPALAVSNTFGSTLTFLDSGRPEARQESIAEGARKITALQVPWHDVSYGVSVLWATFHREKMHLKSLLVLALVGCGGGGGIDPTPNLVIAKTSGDEQVGLVNQQLANPIQVLVTEGNAPVAGATVTWLVDISNGTFEPTSVVTDANGFAATAWTLGTNQGAQRSTARVTSGSSNPSVIFNAMAVHDVAVSLVKVTGDNQRATVGSQLRTIQARVIDQFENGVEGVGVSWSVSAGTVTREQDVTGPGGLTGVDVTLGPTGGSITITATANGLDGSPLTFNATADPIPTVADVLVGNIFFTSDQNSSSDPAVDTVAVGGTVTWTWGVTGIAQHSVRSQGTPSFTSSDTKLGNGQTYSFTFTAPGSYNYDCAVHGSQMTGRIVVR